MIALTVYVVRRPSGEYFRAAGFGGGRGQWVTDIAKSRIYASIGPAKARLAFFPDAVVVELVANESRVIEREPQKPRCTKERRELADARRRAAEAQGAVDAAQARLNAAMARSE